MNSRSPITRSPITRSPITHVAIRFQGKVFSLPRPNRHHDVIRHIVETLGVNCVDTQGDDQGFLDAEGRYLNRQQALVSALQNDQIKGEVLCGMLFSENLW